MVEIETQRCAIREYDQSGFRFMVHYYLYGGASAEYRSSWHTSLEKYIKATEITNWFKTHEPFTHQVAETKGLMYLPLKGWVEHDCSDIGNYIMAIKKLDK